MTNFPGYTGTPMSHQKEWIEKAFTKPEFAFFWEMGLGKTYTLIHLASFREHAGLINTVVLFCPTPIKLVWEEEIPKWSPIDHQVHVYKNRKQLEHFYRDWRPGLKWVIVGIEALSSGSAFESIQWLLKQKGVKAQCSIDESSRIKNYKAKRTKKAITIGQLCDYRTIMTGTPITQSMEDLFAQMGFLNSDIIGCKKSIVLFRNKYCVMGGFEGRKIIGYQNEEDLLGKISPYSSVLKITDVLDLPRKIYLTIPVDATPTQLKAIDQLKKTFMAEDNGNVIETGTVLERLTRYQQILGGNFPHNIDDNTYETSPLSGGNPKLNALMELIEDKPVSTKVIIWARFRPEIDAIMAELGDKAVAFHGGCSDEERKHAVESFQNGDAQFFVSNQATGGMGLTLTAATWSIYYSNSFSYEDRVQSEARNWRKGQDRPVIYFDIVVNHPADQMIIYALEAKGDLASYVNKKLKKGESVL